jgi:hypothetical protein
LISKVELRGRRPCWTWYFDAETFLEPRGVLVAFDVM